MSQHPGVFSRRSRFSSTAEAMSRWLVSSRDFHLRMTVQMAPTMGDIFPGLRRNELCGKCTSQRPKPQRRQAGWRPSLSMEELVAELCAAFLCADLRIADLPHIGHAQYLEAWLEELKTDKKAIFTAAWKASQAADLWRHSSRPPTERASTRRRIACGPLFDHNGCLRLGHNKRSPGKIRIGFA